MFWIENNGCGSLLVTSQCFTNALYVENENGSGKLNIQFRQHIQTWTHLQRLPWQRAEGNRVTCYDQLSNHGSRSSLPLPTDFPTSLFSFLLITLSIKHFTTTLPFCQNTIFLLLFIIFLLQNMYRLFRTTTKIQYYMQFHLFNNHQFITWILLEFVFLLIVPSSRSKMAYSPSGCCGSGYK